MTRPDVLMRMWVLLPEVSWTPASQTSHTLRTSQRSIAVVLSRELAQ